MQSEHQPPTSTPLEKLQQGDTEYDELDEDEFQSDSEEGFSIKELQPAQANVLSTRDLHNLIHDGAIDLNPPYQRDVVWPTTKQVKLIDSIYRNFYIPPVVFAVQKDEDGEDVRICVDGKQRLTSIQKFFDGQVYRDTRTRQSYWYTISDSVKSLRHEVPKYWKEKFSEKKITCVEYQGLTADQERDIFQRVQLGMSLTAAEKLQAISSPWASWISELEAKHVSVDDGLTSQFEWDIKRGRDFQNIAHFVYCCDGIPDDRVPSAQKLEKWLSRVDPPGEQFQREIDDVLRELWMIAKEKPLNKGFTAIEKRLAPVEFVFIGVLLYILRNRSREDRGAAIYHLRTAVRAEFKDIRNNSLVSRAMWGYIHDMTKNPTSSFAYRDNNKSRKKRKADDDGDEYRPEPVKTLGKAVKTRSKAPKT
ncbi:hypothetical protein M378DRAFT_191070 [Amanita muscaria Koide BX008]|uniref:GmrSD restriction endonucleases N-terminal domain-containing protein n=1 Tax=Amanita muscaria (strain Koide BX008) TaxID=946122 RepID=A0A0C2SX59_AMAMK|nr:hypothetical protein M378DRAFT_191070 [Amanita muscaria Koide BX008]